MKNVRFLQGGVIKSIQAGLWCFFFCIQNVWSLQGRVIKSVQAGLKCFCCMQNVLSMQGGVIKCIQTGLQYMCCMQNDWSLQGGVIKSIQAGLQCVCCMQNVESQLDDVWSQEAWCSPGKKDTSAHPCSELVLWIGWRTLACSMVHIYLSHHMA